MKYWDKMELECLVTHYPHLPESELVNLFPNRTYDAIQRKASTLNIRRLAPFHHTLESKAKMSRAHLGHKLSLDHKMSLRRCLLDESVFDTLSEQSAYWIGFLIADGNISYKKGIPIIALHLKEGDLQHLMKFRSFVHSSHKIGSYINKTWGNKSYSISFSSERIANSLIKYGCVPKKCFVAEIKGDIQFNRHLWRGILDGDGSLGLYSRLNGNGSVRKVPYISLTGTYNVCRQFRDFLQKQLEPMPQKIIPSKRSYFFMVSDHRAIKAIKLLYDNCKVALDRKLIQTDTIINSSILSQRCVNRSSDSMESNL